MAGSTRAVLRTNIRNQKGESGSTWTTDAEIDQWIQDGHDDLAKYTKYYKQSAEADTVADQAAYSLADLKLVQIERVRIGLSATATVYTDISEMDGGWQAYLDAINNYDGYAAITNTGTPNCWAWDGMDYLYLNPAPDYATTGGGSYTYGIKIYYAGMELMDDDADTTHVPRFAEKAIVYYGLAQWHEKDSSPLQGYYLQQYEKAKTELFVWVKGGGRTVGPKRISTDEERPTLRL